MHITLNMAASLKQEDCLPNMLATRQLLMAEGKGRFPVCQRSSIRMRVERQMGSGPKVSC